MKQIILSIISLLIYTNFGVAKDIEFNTSVVAYSQDKILVSVDVKVNYKLQEPLPNEAPNEEDISEWLKNTINDSVKSFCNTVLGAESFLLPETKQRLFSALNKDMNRVFNDSKVQVQTASIDKITLSKYVMQAIEARKSQKQAVANQMAEIQKLKRQRQNK